MDLLPGSRRSRPPSPHPRKDGTGTPGAGPSSPGGSSHFAACCSHETGCDSSASGSGTAPSRHHGHDPAVIPSMRTGRAATPPISCSVSTDHNLPTTTALATSGSSCAGRCGSLGRNRTCGPRFRKRVSMDVHGGRLTVWFPLVVAAAGASVAMGPTSVRCCVPTWCRQPRRACERRSALLDHADPLVTIQPEVPVGDDGAGLLQLVLGAADQRGGAADGGAHLTTCRIERRSAGRIRVGEVTVHDRRTRCRGTCGRRRRWRPRGAARASGRTQRCGRASGWATGGRWSGTRERVYEGADRLFQDRLEPPLGTDQMPGPSLWERMLE